MAADIVWLSSFPKSGSTWFRLLLANWREAGETPVSINKLASPGDHLFTREAFDEATLLNSGLLHPEEIDSLRGGVYRLLTGEAAGRWYVKVHEAFRRNAEGEPFLGSGAVRAAIYLVRDPRDVAASLAAHFDISIDRAITIINSRGAILSAPSGRQALQLRQPMLGWSGHAESWLDQTDVPVHLVRYEDLKADTAAVFAGALEFLGEHVESHRVERAVRNSEFREVQRQEREAGFQERLSATTPFFRQGRTGGWSSELTPEQVERLVNANRTVMRRLGYALPAVCAVGSSSDEACVRLCGVALKALAAKEDTGVFRKADPRVCPALPG
jgi:aryl sulfotransferase